MNGIVERFAALFEGRADAFGTDAGGCFRSDGDTQLVRVRDHLAGSTPIGVYPMVPNTLPAWPDTIDRRLVKEYPWLVKWGCVDLDVKGPSHATGYDSEQEALEAALNLTAALRALGIVGWIERTRSRGYHVWVLASEWVSAATMRRALLVACSVVEVPPSEVNPKSEGFESTETLGNYVRLPYPGALANNPPVDQCRMVLEPSGSAMGLTTFLDAAEASLTPTNALAEAVSLWTPPVLHHEKTMEFSGEVQLDEALTKRLGGLSFTILNEGPLEGGDRSGALFKLAHSCAKDGLSADEALAVVTAADRSWGKYWKRHNGDSYLRRTVEKAYV